MSKRALGFIVFVSAVILLTGSLLVVRGGPATAPSAAAQVIPPPQGITVGGRGEIKAQPDTANVTVGAQTTGTTAQEAQSENARIMTAINANLQAVGIDRNDMRTTGLNLFPISEPNRPN